MPADYKKLREDAGMTLAKLASLSDYSISTINRLELHGDGSSRLKKVLSDILAAGNLQAKNTIPVTQPVNVVSTSGSCVGMLDVKMMSDELLRQVLAEFGQKISTAQGEEVNRLMDAMQAVHAEIKRRGK